jgi:alpha-N-arabinofuranosidase
MMKRIIVGTFLMLLWVSSAQILTAQEAVQVKLNPNSEAPQINKHIYGHFAEHLGRCIYGGFYVGEDSEIPNTLGVRNDVVEALKELEIPNLRWPGGCFADTYHWKDGIGPKEDRPSILNVWWGNVKEDNSFGTHEFLNMCELLETEPYLSGNVGSGTPQELADWIKYTNHPAGTSPMPELREKNGRTEPWKVTFWGIGNEAWGCGGHMTPEYYSDNYRRFATYTTDWRNSDQLYRVASGASSQDYHWTEVLMQNIPKHMIEAIALHHYSVIDWGNKGHAVNYDEETYFKTMKEALLMEELIQKHVAIMDKYDEEQKVDLIVDEWGGWYDEAEGTHPGFLYQQNTMRDAMIAGSTLNTFNNHADRVKMANLAQAVNVLQAVILTDEEKLILTPTYHVMNMYKVHQDAQLIPVEFKSPLYKLGEESLPAISVSASTKENKTHISLVNIDAKKSHEIELDLSGLDLDDFKAEILASENLQDHNSFENPNQVNVESYEDFKVKKDILKLTLPPFSVVVIEASNK